MIFSVTFSKATANVEATLERPYTKIKIKLETSSSADSKYFVEMFTKTQVFHKRISVAELDSFIEENAGKTFKNCVVRTENEEITYMANKKGKVTRLVKKIANKESELGAAGIFLMADSKKKNYLLQEGLAAPFLVRLGVMTTDGKVINSKYDKFRQINRFLEFINDVLPEFKDFTEPIRIADFGCGKSYLTFAVHYFLTEVKKIPCKIEGLDLKNDVIDYCNRLVEELGLKDIHFSVGDISDYAGEKNPDIVITLHACDTATDFALKYAVSKNAKVILSVPCCQHEVNKQLQKRKTESAQSGENDIFEPLLKWGIVREKFASLVTDAIRAEWLESQGYNVQMLEFIDMEHTPKNILIRAGNHGVVSAGFREQRSLGEGGVGATKCDAGGKLSPTLASALNISPEILNS